jgi:hypothetical protein
MNSQNSKTQTTTPNLKGAFFKEACVYLGVACAGLLSGVVGINSLLGAASPEYADKQEARCMLEKEPNPDDPLNHPSFYCINWFASAPAAWISRSLGHEPEPE